MPTGIRPAVPSDVDQINAIHTYYILNTISTFALTPITPSETLSTLTKIQNAGLPYLVATDQEPEGDIIVGYIYLSPFRSAKGGFLHTVELSLYCHPEHLSRGLGTMMLRKVLEILEKPDGFDDTWLGGTRRGDDARIREVIVCMSVDKSKEKDGEGLVKWYGRFGFEKAGRLRNVGRKFDKWLDTIYLQRHIE